MPTENFGLASHCSQSMPKVGLKGTLDSGVHGGTSVGERKVAMQLHMWGKVVDGVTRHLVVVHWINCFVMFICVSIERDRPGPRFHLQFCNKQMGYKAKMKNTCVLCII
jgi:hypothetical protein